jgi:hypothetical protein
MAATLALATAIVTYSRGGEIPWAFVAAAVFSAAIGLVAWKRSRSAGN